MELTEIFNAISTVGFPIVISVLLLFYMNKQNELHREELTGLRDVIEKNTQSITVLTERIKGSD